MRVSSTAVALLGTAVLAAGCGEDRGPGSVAGAITAAEAGVAGWTSPESRFPRSAVDDPVQTVDASSVEVSEDGTRLTAGFVGAGGVEGEPCGADYTAYPVLGPSAVALVIGATPTRGGRGCSDVGYHREVEVVLPEPLGERTVVGLDGTPVPLDPTAPPCTGGWTFALPADFEGAADPQAALEEWLALDPSEQTAPEAGTPRTGWTAEGSDRDDRVVYEARDLAVTVSRSTRDEWRVTTVECLPPAGAPS